MKNKKSKVKRKSTRKPTLDKQLLKIISNALLNLTKKSPKRKSSSSKRKTSSKSSASSKKTEHKKSPSIQRISSTKKLLVKEIRKLKEERKKKKKLTYNINAKPYSISPQKVSKRKPEQQYKPEKYESKQQYKPKVQIKKHKIESIKKPSVKVKKEKSESIKPLSKTPKKFQKKIDIIDLTKENLNFSFYKPQRITSSELDKPLKKLYSKTSWSEKSVPRIKIKPPTFSITPTNISPPQRFITPPPRFITPPPTTPSHFRKRLSTIVDDKELLYR